jgi:hypothetical protein
MRKLVISAFALAAMTSFAMAGEPVKLTSSQLDLVAAGNPCSKSVNVASAQICTTTQVNALVQTAAAAGGCNLVAACVGGGNGNAKASNFAIQSNSIR